MLSRTPGKASGTEKVAVIQFRQIDGFLEGFHIAVRHLKRSKLQALKGYFVLIMPAAGDLVSALLYQ